MKQSVNVLTAQGYRLTKPRLQVLAVLKQLKQPVAVKVIYQRLKKQGIDLVSIYRALDLFVSLGFVFAEIFGKDKRYYLADQPHHHISCFKCRKVACLPCQHNFSKIKGFKKVSHQLVLTGLCQACS
ncbi:transcriptional repressor [Patescibacteria group bacterium]|nr:transcriptional repressor [Patescibacteria group bacterium]